ncbi:hypothetical protein AB7C87_19485 [Natrarchaeobius sp. A-rgal3]
MTDPFELELVAVSILRPLGETVGRRFVTRKIGDSGELRSDGPLF